MVLGDLLRPAVLHVEDGIRIERGDAVHQDGDRVARDGGRPLAGRRRCRTEFVSVRTLLTFPPPILTRQRMTRASEMMRPAWTISSQPRS
jgi:hypothetical protein